LLEDFVHELIIQDYVYTTIIFVASNR
jgi:hypothetical protein